MPEQSRGAEPPSLALLPTALCMQDVDVYLGCEHTLLGRVKLLVSQHPPVLLVRAALNPFPTWPLFVLRIALSHVQDLQELPFQHSSHWSPDRLQ